MPGPRARPWIALVLACAWAPAAPTARAEPAALALSWDAPAGCPDREAVAAGVARQRRADGEGATGVGSVVAEGTVYAGDGGYRLSLRLSRGEVDSARTLSAPHCDELAAAAALLIAMALDGDVPVPDPDPDPDPEPEPEPPGPPWAFQVSPSLGVLFDSGSLPSASAGMDGGLWTAYGPLRAGAAAFVLFGGEAEVPAVGGDARADMWGLSGQFCWAAIQGVFELAPCAVGEFGRYRAWATALADARHPAASWRAGGPGLRARMSIGGQWWVGVSGALLFVAERPQLWIDTPTGPLLAHETAPSALRLALRAGYDL